MVGGAPKPAAIDCGPLGQSKCNDPGGCNPYICFPAPNLCLPVHGTVICGADIDCPERAPICITWTGDSTCVTEPELDCLCASAAGKSLIPRCAAVMGGKRACLRGGGICDGVPCCEGSTCVQGADGMARCQEPCSTAADCQTGCCQSQGAAGGKVCAVGASCCQPQDAPCDETKQFCCADATCVIFVDLPGQQLCKKTCTQNGDCPTGCCAPLGDSGVRACLDKSYCR